MNELTAVKSAFPAKICQEDSPVVAIDLPKLNDEQQAFVLEVFRSQEQQKIYLANKLEVTEQERRRYQETMLRHAAALSYSIVEKFVDTINKTPELQRILNINPKNKNPVKLEELVTNLERLLKEEKPPKCFQEDDTLKDWVWGSRGIEATLQPIVDDINNFLNAFGVENLKKHCPEILEKDLEEQLKIALTPAPEGPSKLEMAGTGLRFIFHVLYVMAGLVKDGGLLAGMGILILKSPSVGLIQIVLNTLIRILIR